LRAAGTQEEFGRLLLKNSLRSKTHIFGSPGSYRDFHNLNYLEYAYIQLGRYHDAQHTVDIIKAQYEALPDKTTAPDTPELQSRHVRGRTIYAVPIEWCMVISICSPAWLWNQVPSRDFAAP
jgi:hypothetical protein